MVAGNIKRPKSTKRNILAQSKQINPLQGFNKKTTAFRKTSFKD